MILPGPFSFTEEDGDRGGRWRNTYQAPRWAINRLINLGSAAPGFDDPEGIIVFHTAANSMFKVTVKDDEKAKGDKTNDKN